MLAQELKKSFWNGLQFGSIIGTFGLSVSLIFSLVTTQGYNNFLRIKGATWEAIFVLLATISAVSFGILLFIAIVKVFQGNFRDSKITEQFFDGDKRINSKKSRKK